MRIAYCIESMAGKGGMEKIVSQKANYLSDKLGYTVDIITARQGNNKCPFFLSQNVQIIDLGVPFNSGGSRFQKSPYKKWHKKLEEYLYNSDYDIVISTGGKDLDFLYKINDSSVKIAEYHFSFNTIGYWEKNRRKNIIGKIIGQIKTFRAILNAAKYDRFVVLSNSEYILWSRFLRNCEYIYNSIDIPPTECPYQPNSKIVITAGRLDPLKGHDYLIQSWKYINEKYSDWKLHIFGEGNTTKLQQLIDKLGLQNSISLLGHSNNLPREFCDASFFVLSSRIEGFGLVIAEAQACGLPVVSYDTPTGPAEIINNNIDGILVAEVGDIQGLSSAIELLIKSPNIRKDMSTKAKINAQRFDKSRIMDKWDKLFKELVSNRK